MNEHFYYDGELQVCKALCDYFKVDIKVPTKDFADSFSNLSEEVLYLSGIRYKNVQLYGKWWKHANGAMLGHLDTGTPIALLPDRISGYRAYDPIQDKTYRVDDTEAAKIKTQVTAVFRAFPTEKVHLKHIVNFIVGENIYKEIAIIILCSFLAGIIQMIPPFVAAHIFDVIIPENLRTMMFEVIFMLLAFALANVGFSVMINMSVTRIKIKSSLAVQAALWDRLISLRVPFFSKYTTGELLHKIRNIEQVKDMVSLESLQSIFANLFAFVYIIALYNFSTSITNYVLSMFLILFLAYGIAIKRKFKLHKHYTDLENRSMSFNHQCVRGMYRIKVSGAEERVFKKWTDYEEEKRSVTNRIRSINNFLNSFHLFFDFASAAIVYLLIARAGYVDVGMFIAYVSIFLILQRSVRRLLRTLNILPRLMAACANVKPILDAEPEYNSQKLIPKDMRNTLEVNHASFKFSQYGRTILSEISFRAEEGESIGIVGLSGGGKTTLLKLLMGFYDLSGGKIYYGGYDSETMDMRYLRKHIGVVLQNGMLSFGDIYSNVTDNDNTVGHDAVINAIQKVGLEEKINSLPDGLYTRMEHCPLSEGERQRLLIARAIARKNMFIFLDEATRSLDNISQGIILKNLSEIPATKIIIAQRLVTVQYCDKIIVMEKGQITAQGSYSQIMNNQ